MSGFVDSSLDQSRELLLAEKRSRKRSYGSVQSPSDDHNAKPRLLTVAYSCVVIIQSWLVIGLTIGYTSPVLCDLEDSSTNKSSAPLNKTSYQDLFSMLLPVGALIGTIIAGWIIDKIGRKLTLLVCSIVFATGWLLIILTLLTNGTVFLLLIFAGRFIGGIGVGFATLCAPLYLAEISPRKYRGTFGVMNEFALTSGVFVGQLAGDYISYYWLAVASLSVTCLYTVPAISLKESPRWLLTKGRNREAKDILLWLRGGEYDVDREIQEIEEQCGSHKTLSLSEIMQEFQKYSVYYPVLLAVLIVFFQSLTGIDAIVFNAKDIYKHAKVPYPGVMASVTCGGVQSLFALVGARLTDILGRRTLLITSSVFIIFSLAAMGAYEMFYYNPNCYPVFAIIIMTFFIGGFSIGWGAVTFVYLSEIVPLRVRGIGVGIATTASWFFLSVSTGLFRNYQIAVKPWGTFWSFSVVSICGLIYVIIFIPETKGKSLEEIENYFKRKSKNINRQEADQKHLH